MRLLPHLLLAVLITFSASSRADLIFFKDGYVLQGKVRRDYTASFDSASRDMIMMPKGFFKLDDGPRLMYFSPAQVRIVEQMSHPAQEHVISKEERILLKPQIMPPILEVVEVGNWNFKKWEREFYFRSPDHPRIGFIQGLANLSPYYAQVHAYNKFRWGGAYLTREWEPDIVLELLRNHPAFQESGKDKPAVNIAKRMRICDFLVQAGFFDFASKELDRLVKDFPDQKERVDSARLLLEKLQAREESEQIKNWYQAGRYRDVDRRLNHFAIQNVPDRIQADLREMRDRLTRNATLLEQVTTALEECGKEAMTPAGRALASVAEVIKMELHASNVERLDAFVGQFRDASRQKVRGKKPAMGPDELLSLAVTGWLLGSPSAEARPPFAINLWKTRQMILEYLQETDAFARKKILADYEAKITPRVDLDEIAQLIDKLPPAQPAEDTSNDVQTRQVGSGRNQTTYHIKLPPEYTHNRPYPVLFVLHDSGHRATEMLAQWKYQAAEHGYILVAPEWSRGFASNYGFTEREHDTVLNTLWDLRRRYQIDSDRVFLYGLGEGGRMAFDVGLAHPDLFAGLLPMGAGPSFYPRRYWRNAQYLPIYAVSGSRAGDSHSLLTEQFTNWVQRGYPALWIEYKGRGVEFFSGELTNMFDWMRHQKRAFPLHQLGTDGAGSQFGDEFCLLRPEDNKFYWLSTTGLSPRYTILPNNWNGTTQPAALTGRIDPMTNEIVLKTQGLTQVTIWLGRNSVGQYMIDFDKPVSVRVAFTNYVNNRRITPTLGVLLDDLYTRGDRKQLYMARIDLNLR